jgi:hypothetical protein
MKKQYFILLITLLLTTSNKASNYTDPDVFTFFNKIDTELTEKNEQICVLALADWKAQEEFSKKAAQPKDLSLIALADICPWSPSRLVKKILNHDRTHSQ